MGLELITIIGGGITAFIATVIALRKLKKWLFPVIIRPSYYICFNGSNPDTIDAEVTNRSSENIYITECSARGTYSLWHILKVHFRKPFIKPMLYQNVWYNGPVYSLLDEEASIKIEPGQPLKLEYQFYDHPLNAMFTPYFVVIVKLSSGRKFRSKKLRAPVRWRYIGKEYYQQNA